MTVEMRPENHQPTDHEQQPNDDEGNVQIPRRAIERGIIGVLALIGAGGGGLALHDKIAQPSNIEVTQDFRHLHDVLEGKVDANQSQNVQRYEKVQSEVTTLRQDMAECRKNILDYLWQRRNSGGMIPQGEPGIADWIK